MSAPVSSCLNYMCTLSSLSPVRSMNESTPRTPDPASSHSPLPSSPVHGQTAEERNDARIQKLLDLQERREAEVARLDSPWRKRDQDQEKIRELSQYKHELDTVKEDFRVISEDLKATTLALKEERLKMREETVERHSQCDDKFAALDQKIAALELDAIKSREEHEETRGTLADLSAWASSDVIRFLASSRVYTDIN